MTLLPRAGRLLLAAALAPLVVGCASLRARLPWGHPPELTEAAFVAKKIPTFRITRGADTVIGDVASHRIRDGETLLDVARWYDVGYNEIVDANPGVDAFVPPAGADVVVPTAWVLPCCTYEGIVVNIPEMRLYYFRPAPNDPAVTLVDTYPVGLGREDWRTP